MTTVFPKEVSCALCGNEQTVQVMGSTNFFGSMDLDTRPPEMRRSTMRLWLQTCNVCGFVAADLEEKSPSDELAVATAGYRAESGNKSRLPLANQFVCRSILDEAAGDLASAGWRLLHAAWVCDDRQQDAESRLLRLAAIELFERSRAQGKPAVEKMAGGDELLLCDLARRAGEFPRALEYCAAGIALEVQPFIRQLLELEQTLCVARDTTCHKVSEVDGSGAGASATMH